MLSRAFPAVPFILLDHTLHIIAQCVCLFLLGAGGNDRAPVTELGAGGGGPLGDSAPWRFRLPRQHGHGAGPGAVRRSRDAQKRTD